MAKGSEFEREICKELSRWWTGGKRDDVFWRTAMSGGRATVRSRQGKTTAGSYGDITAIDPVGFPFLKAFAMELKRGYNKATIHEIMDAPSKAAEQTIITWIKQVEASRVQSNARWWMIIHRRDRRVPMVYLPRVAAQALLGPNLPMADSLSFAVPTRLRLKENVGSFHMIHVMPLSRFFDQVEPRIVKGSVNAKA